MPRHTLSVSDVRQAIEALTGRPLAELEANDWPGIWAIRDYTKGKFPVAGNPSTITKHRRALQLWAQQERAAPARPLPEPVQAAAQAAAERIWKELLEAGTKLEEELTAKGAEQIAQAQAAQQAAEQATAELRTQHQALAAELTATAQARDDGAKAAADLQRQLEARERALTKLQAEQQGLQDLVQELRNTQGHLDKQLAADRQDAKTEREALERRAHEERRTLEARHGEEIAQLRTELRAALDRHEESRERSIATEQRLREKLARATAAAESYEGRLHALEQTHKLTLEASAQLDATLAQAQAHSEAAREQIQALTVERQQLQSTRDEWMEKAARVPVLEARIAELSTALREASGTDRRPPPAKDT